jgi:hypothetical protein
MKIRTSIGSITLPQTGGAKRENRPNLIQFAEVEYALVVFGRKLEFTRVIRTARARRKFQAKLKKLEGFLKVSVNLPSCVAYSTYHRRRSFCRMRCRSLKKSVAQNEYM